MSMPFYVSPEQSMRDKADYARKGIARGRSCVALQYAGGILLVAPNPSSALHKISEIYDRIGFAAVGRYNEYENLRKAGVTYADITGYQFDRHDVTARGIANWYAQTLGTIFTESPKPFEVEIVVAEVGVQPRGRPDLPDHVRRLGDRRARLRGLRRPGGPGVRGAEGTLLRRHVPVRGVRRRAGRAVRPGQRRAPPSSPPPSSRWPSSTVPATTGPSAASGPPAWKNCSPRPAPPRPPRPPTDSSDAAPSGSAPSGTAPSGAPGTSRLLRPVQLDWPLQPQLSLRHGASHRPRAGRLRPRHRPRRRLPALTRPPRLCSPASTARSHPRAQHHGRPGRQPRGGVLSYHSTHRHHGRTAHHRAGPLGAKRTTTMSHRGGPDRDDRRHRRGSRGPGRSVLL